MKNSNNVDEEVVQSFGKEWTIFDYSDFPETQLRENFMQYFSIFPWDSIDQSSSGFDMGCGSGRWARFVAPRVKNLVCIDPSDSIFVAEKNLSDLDNVSFLKEASYEVSLRSESQDFGYCLGVLHHVPNPEEALKDCVRLLKEGAPFLLYLYYRFDNRSPWFIGLWRMSDVARKVVSRLPYGLRKQISSLLAIIIYIPLSRFAGLLEKIGFEVDSFPLSDYRTKSFYQCANDALDRFGTSTEWRFTRNEISDLLERNGMERVHFSNNAPYWVCVSYKTSTSQSEKKR